MQTRPSSNRWELTQQTFEGLLRSLDSKQEAAVERYSRLHGRLVFFFMRHRSRHPEDLADQVVNRLACKLSEGLTIENIESFALGVARMVAREDQARNLREQALYVEFGRNESMLHRTLNERENLKHVTGNLMEDQLAALPVAQRSMLVRYHDGRGIQRIRERQKLAEEMGVNIGTLRKRIFDLQAMLRMRLSRATGATEPAIERNRRSEEQDYL